MRWNPVGGLAVHMKAPAIRHLPPAIPTTPTIKWKASSKITNHVAKHNTVLIS